MTGNRISQNKIRYILEPKKGGFIFRYSKKTKQTKKFFHQKNPTKKKNNNENPKQSKRKHQQTNQPKNPQTIKDISKMRFTEFSPCPHCVLYNFPQYIRSKQARTLNEFLPHCFCNCSDTLRIRTYILGYHDMRMVASKKIKYARKIKSLSGIFNRALPCL